MHMPHLKWATRPPPLPPFLGFAAASKAFRTEDVQEDGSVWPDQG